SRVASKLASFSGIGGGYPGRPGSTLLQCRLLMRLRVAPNPASSGSADGESPGCPEVRSFGAGGWISGFPQILAPSGFAAHASSGCPESCTCGWVDDDFPIVLELC